LTGRDIAVLDCVASGLTDEEIALRMGFKVPSVKRQVRSIIQKLKVASRTEAAIKAIRTGIINPSMMGGLILSLGSIV